MSHAVHYVVGMRFPAVIVLTALVAVSCTATSGTTSTVAVPEDVIPTTSSPVAEPMESPGPTIVTSPTTATTSLPSTTTTTTLDLDAAGARMQADLSAIVGFGVRAAGSQAEAETAGFIIDALEQIGLPVEMREVALPTGLSSANVIASVGTGQTHVLLGAHYDTKPPSPGADDNGSGTVVLLELARRLATSSLTGLRVTLVFFGAEEILVGYSPDDHHFGSRLLAEEMEAAGDLPDLMISADMIGVGSEILAATYLDFDPTAGDLIVEAATLVGASVDKQSRGDISDHEAFARKGVPSVMLWRPDNPDYHRITDIEVRSDALIEDLAILEAFLTLLTAAG